MTARVLFNQYIQRLTQVAETGDAREESFYGVLADLLRRIAQTTGRAHVRVTTLPKPTEAGNPDFRVWTGDDRIVGYIEAKRPTETNLDLIETSGQLQRYRGTFANLILTNFLEFRLYRNGERIATAVLARPFAFNQLRTAPPLEHPNELWELLDRFLGFSLPQTYTAESLAAELAKRTRFLRDMVAHQLAVEQVQGAGTLAGFYEAFQTFLIGSLTPSSFADFYAQTITYGLFAARTRADNGFTRRKAFDAIPHSIGILRDVFRFISLSDLPAPLEWIVDDIAGVLAAADASGILGSYYHEGKGSDPIIHFYETFLAEYDPEERERLGVYYTPEPVVSYIVRSLHDILKQEFGLADGLASMGLTLLDPAAGTMTFVAHAAQQAVREFERKYGTGAREEFIRQHVLRSFYAFELMMAPYAVGHLKMSFFLEELGHRLSLDERVPFYLTNTLEMDELEASTLPGFSSLAEESRLAGAVKRDIPILVVLGNPPYSGISFNMGEWITGLIEDYKYVDGVHFGERKHWLQDDYVKFLRFAEWKIAQAGRGIVGIITNHGYLTNPTFRGMRWHLMQTFDEIRVLDLHGNSLRKEVCPDGSPDENVFDIRQGVAIAFFVKRGSKAKDSDATVLHSELWGLRQRKYDWLEAQDLQHTKWETLRPQSPFLLFAPRDHTLETTYRRYPSVAELFPVNSVGIVSARDRLTIHRSPDDVWQTVRAFSRMDPELARQGYNLGRDARDWKVTQAQKDLLDSGPARERIVPLLYRPFDVRYTYYTGQSRGFIGQPQRRVMHHMLAGDNLALVLPKRVEYIGAWCNAFVTQTISEHVAVSLKTTDYHLPLYLYPNDMHDDLFAALEGNERRPNLSAPVVGALAQAHGQIPEPKDVFHYVYAILYAETYRVAYAEFLRMDFPRIPLTSDGALFRTLAALGERLVAVHLVRSPELDPPLARFEGDGDNRVAPRGPGALRYEAETQRVYINKSQYFAPVQEYVWGYHIGGYQVCDKWLKDRRECRLALDEIRIYCRIVTALQRTMEIQAEIDVLYPRVEETLLG